MSEFIQSDEDIDAAVTNELLGVLDADYVSCEPQPKHLNVIFEQLRYTQGLFASEFRYSSPDVAVLAGQQFANRINEHLEQLPENERLIGVPAALSGPGVTASRMSINYTTGEMTAGPNAPEGDEGVFEAQTSDVVGLFRGIGVLVRNCDEDGMTYDAADDAPYYVKLYYQVEMGVFKHPYGQNAQYALGEIGIATLSFEEDTEREAVREALTQLLSTDSIRVAELVNDLNRTLTNPKHGAKQVRKIGTLVRQLHECDQLRPADSEAILDLITTYIPPQSSYEIHVSDALQYEKNLESGKVEQSVITASDGGPIIFQQDISDIILSFGYDPALGDQMPNTLKTGGVEPYFVIEADGTVIHAPMRRVVAFGDVS
jgi:hypothetical protein